MKDRADTVIALWNKGLIVPKIVAELSDIPQDEIEDIIEDRANYISPSSISGIRGGQMKTIKLYTEKDMEIDRGNVISGIDCSIKKWESIDRALGEIIRVIESPCGLCDERVKYFLCPLHEMDITCCEAFNDTVDKLDILLVATHNMLTRLQSIKAEGK